MANPIVTIKIKDMGDIKAELYPEIAPITVENFVKLAGSGFYNGLTFHRIIPGFMIQGGDPEGPNSLIHTRGVLSMARSMMPDSAGSQFFIMHEDAPHLDGQYAAFGKVIEGIEVVDKVASVKTDYNDKPLEPVVIEIMSVEV